ncbi:MAG TPA: hypothetical protein VI306_21880 [Pyrinomonadaceae bacterium]
MPSCVNKWGSWVNQHVPPTTGENSNDGIILVRKNANGALEGHHDNSGQDLTDVNCVSLVLSFKRKEGNTTYTYSGKVTSEMINGTLTDVIRGGNRHRSVGTDAVESADAQYEARSNTAAPGDDEPWDAIKTT